MSHTFFVAHAATVWFTSAEKDAVTTLPRRAKVTQPTVMLAVFSNAVNRAFWLVFTDTAPSAVDCAVSTSVSFWDL